MDQLTPSETRQAWLETAVRDLRPYFKVFGGTIPDTLRISIGMTSTRKHIGECYYSTASSDGHREIFVSPVLGDSEGILGTLAHELVHAALPDGEGHGKLFGALARAIGLEGKLTATTVGPALKAWIEAFIERHGAYPAGSLDLSRRKVQKTYLLKAMCEATGYTVRVTAKWVDDFGTPICPCCHNEMEIG